eukprot:m.85857 g.85857  ORF g.85857 m.85857 type:complete len:428 (+) comp8753_c0_seq8:188-1471(+)
MVVTRLHRQFTRVCSSSFHTSFALTSKNIGGSIPTLLPPKAASQKRRDIVNHNRGGVDNCKNEDSVIFGLNGGGSSEVTSMISLPDDPPDAKFLEVAIVGLPNVGKSTIINTLLGKKTAAVSPKAHTTRNQIESVLTQGNTQIVFVDTPGFMDYRFARKTKMKRSIVVDTRLAIDKADLVVAVVDDVLIRKYGVTQLATPELFMRELGKNTGLTEEMLKKRAVLVLNKVDKLSEDTRGELEMEFTRNNSRTEIEASGDDRLSIPSSKRFERLFQVCAFEPQSLLPLKDYLFEQAVSGLWHYNSHVTSSLSFEDSIEEIVREQMFLRYDAEVPYVCQHKLEYVESFDKDSHIDIGWRIEAQNHSQKAIIIGKGGSKITPLAQAVEREIGRRLNVSASFIVNIVSVGVSGKKKGGSSHSSRNKRRKITV